MITELSPGTLINHRYLIQKILGQGGFGRTYLAVDTQRFNEACVLKEFVPATTKEDIIRKSRELFEREAKVLYKIEHPQIPKFLAFFTDSQRIFIAQEYIDGKTYSQILYARISGKGKPFSETEVRTWLLDMLPVLEYIHSRQIIHRDISLDNVMLPRNLSKPVLIDFGVVKEKFSQIISSHTPNQPYTTRGSVVGKIGYSPPEQLRLGHCYPKSDIYALGVCAIVLLTGKMPHLLMDDSLNWRWHSHVNISDSLASILDKMLAELPTDRYQSAKEVSVELNKNSPIPHGNITPSVLPKTRQERETDSNLYLTAPVSSQTDFLELVGRELTSFVGPVASFLVRTTLEQNPQIEPKEFIEALAGSIPDIQQAQEFRNRIQLPTKSKLEKLENAINLEEPLENSPAISNPEFLESCRQELTSFVGPVASVILENTLDQYPTLTPKQLIETLVAEIPSQERAQEFKERINKLKNI
jgi:serine/threonine protein kinase